MRLGSRGPFPVLVLAQLFIFVRVIASFPESIHLRLVSFHYLRLFKSPLFLMLFVSCVLVYLNRAFDFPSSCFTDFYGKRFHLRVTEK